jgi:hypothetical protein
MGIAFEMLVKILTGAFSFHALQRAFHVWVTAFIVEYKLVATEL